MAFSIAGEGKRNLPLQGGKAGGTIKCPPQVFDSLQECPEFLRPQVSSEGAPKAAGNNLELTCDPVPVRVVEEAWVMARKRSNDDMLSILVADHEFGAGRHVPPRREVVCDASTPWEFGSHGRCHLSSPRRNLNRAAPRRILASFTWVITCAGAPIYGATNTPFRIKPRSSTCFNRNWATSAREIRGKPERESRSPTR